MEVEGRLFVNTDGVAEAPRDFAAAGVTEVTGDALVAGVCLVGEVDGVTEVSEVSGDTKAVGVSSVGEVDGVTEVSGDAVAGVSSAVEGGDIGDDAVV